MGEWIVFSAASKTFGLPIETVLAVDVVPAVTPLPRTVAHVPGVIYLHGELLPLIDLRPLLGAQGGPPFPSRLLLVTNASGLHAALLTDEVYGVQSTADGERAFAGDGPGLAAWCGEKRVIGTTQVWIIDVSELLTTPQWRQADEGRTATHAQ